MLKVCHPAMRRILDEMSPLLGTTLKLFSNNLVVTRNTVLGDFVEATFDGYASQTPSWAPSFQNGVEDVATTAVCTFTAGAGIGSPESIYGYYFLDENGDYSWGETFELGPVTMATPGQELKVYPQLKIKNYGE